MKHRHLTYSADTPVEELGPAAIDNLLDRGTLTEWRPLARAVADDPWGPLAETVLRILDAHQMYGTGPLWRSYIDTCRVENKPGWPRRASLAELRSLRSRSQAQVGEAMRMNQSEVSRFERRSDVRVSHLAAYARGTGGKLRLVVDYPDAPAVEVTISPDVDRSGTPRPS